MGTTAWHVVTVKFTAGPQTQAVRVSSAWRARSRIFPMEISGTLWVDDVSLRAGGVAAVRWFLDCAFFLDTLHMASSFVIDRPIVSARAVGAEVLAPTQRASGILLVGALLAAPLAFGAVQDWAWGSLGVMVFLLFFSWCIAQARCVFPVAQVSSPALPAGSGDRRVGGLRLFTDGNYSIPQGRASELPRTGRAAARATIYWSPLFLPGVCFFLLGIIQLAGGITMDASATREALLKLATDLVLFFLAVQLLGSGGLRPPEGRRSESAVTTGPFGTGGYRTFAAPAFRWAIVLYTFLLALFAIFQFFSSPGLIYGFVKSPGWTFGPYVNHNHYSQA